LAFKMNLKSNNDVNCSSKHAQWVFCAASLSTDNDRRCKEENMKTFAVNMDKFSSMFVRCQRELTDSFGFQKEKTKMMI